MRKSSERLLAHETRENLTQAVKRPAVDLVCAKLRPSLAMLMGEAGFRALLARALVLATADCVWPSTVQIRADGTWEGLDEFAAQGSSPALAEASIVLVARLLGLLVTFVGEELTFRLLHEIWPEVGLPSDGVVRDYKP